MTITRLSSHPPSAGSSARRTNVAMRRYSTEVERIRLVMPVSSGFVCDTRTKRARHSRSANRGIYTCWCSVSLPQLTTWCRAKKYAGSSTAPTAVHFPQSREQMTLPLPPYCQRIGREVIRRSPLAPLIQSLDYFSAHLMPGVFSTCLLT